MRFSMILEMVDRLSAPAKRARAGVSGLRTSVRQMAAQVRGAARDVNDGTRSIEHFDQRARRLRQVALGRTFQAIGGSVRKLGRDLDGLVRRLKLVERSGQMAGRGLKKMGGMAAGLLKSGLLAGGAAVAGAGAFALFDLFSTAGQFEQYQIQLEGIEGSAKAAKRAMAWVTQFAKITPYELDEVMDAFVALKNFGLDPMDGSLRAMGDAASAMNKPIMAAIEMLTDATTGEFERLKEFGIKARKEGDRTTFHYIKNNKKMQRSVSGDELEIKRTLVEIFADRFGGGMERQSKTMFGIISNLKGMWTEFLLMISNAGVFDWIKNRLQKVLDFVNEMAANGKLEEWSEPPRDCRRPVSSNYAAIGVSSSMA
jgi:phage tail tape-measure protein